MTRRTGMTRRVLTGLVLVVLALAFGASAVGAHAALESSDPEVVYVPSYNPSVVYGTWAYPSYPPYYYPPPAYYYPGGALIRQLFHIGRMHPPEDKYEAWFGPDGPTGPGGHHWEFVL